MKIIYIDERYLEIERDKLLNNGKDSNREYIIDNEYKYDGYMLTYVKYFIFIGVTNVRSSIFISHCNKLTYNEFLIKRLLE